MNQIKHQNILVAPLNWGLGHATRCVPIIKALIQEGYNPIIASDGIALIYLKNEFPELIFEELPSYNINYPASGKYYNWHFLKLFPALCKAIVLEQKKTKKLIKKHNITGIISDNRLGVFAKKIKSVYLTHQVRVFSGMFTWLSSALHQYFIKKHTVCWIPDVENEVNLSGKLSHLKKPLKNTLFIGPIARMKQLNVEKNIDILVILSGPEPQRSFLAEKLLFELNGEPKNIVLIEGIVQEKQTITQLNNIEIYNFMTSVELEITINKSKLVICRSGYTSIMDLAFLKTNTYFIPTLGQKEQEYLAEYLKHKNWVGSCRQSDFTIEKLEDINQYKGFPEIDFDKNWKSLFEVFKP